MTYLEERPEWNGMEWNGLISQFEQAEGNLGLRTLIKGTVKQSTLPRLGLARPISTQQALSLNSLQNSYSYKCLKAGQLISSFTYASKMVRISRFSPADPSVDIALRGTFLTSWSPL